MVLGKVRGQMNVKKIIAREGLILIGILVFSFSLCLLGDFLSHPGKGSALDQSTFQSQFKIIALYLYPLYFLLSLLIYFIIWVMNIKKMMAKVGLILLGCILIGLVTIGITKIDYHFYHLFTKHKPLFYKDILAFIDPFYHTKEFSIFIAISVYPVYLLVNLIRKIKKSQGHI
jgi:hypothetical protein